MVFDRNDLISLWFYTIHSYLHNILRRSGLSDAERKYTERLCNTFVFYVVGHVQRALIALYPPPAVLLQQLGLKSQNDLARTVRRAVSDAELFSYVMLYERCFALSILWRCFLGLPGGSGLRDDHRASRGTLFRYKKRSKQSGDRANSNRNEQPGYLRSASDSHL